MRLNLKALLTFGKTVKIFSFYQSYSLLKFTFKFCWTSHKLISLKALGESFQVNGREMSKLKTTRISLASLMW